MLLENDSIHLEAISSVTCQRLENILQAVDMEFKLSYLQELCQD